MFNNNAWKSVGSVDDLIERQDWETYQLVMRPRELQGDFNGLAKALATSGLATNSFGEVTIGNPDLTNGGQFFEEAYEHVRACLTPDQDLAFQQIMIDAKAIEGFLPQLDVEISDTPHGNVRWHTDQGFEQGRFLCTYTTLATRFRIAGQEIDVGLGTLSRHTTKNSDWKTPAASHRRPPSTGASMETPRLSLKSMLAEFGF